jgi:hypothetical protein
VYDPGKLFREKPWWKRLWWGWVVAFGIVVGIEAVGVAIFDDAGKLASQPTTADPLSEQDTLDAPPATKSCGDFQPPLVRESFFVKVEVVEGNIPCDVAQRVMKDRYRGVPTGLWSCTGLGITAAECEKNRGRQGTIRGLLCYRGPLQSRCP